MKSAQTLLVAYFILTTAITGFAQEDYSLNSKNPILVEGNPPLTQSAVIKLIDMFEFSLAARVNAAERTALTQQIISQWKSGDQTIIQHYQQLLAIYERLSALDNAKLREAQVQFQEALLSELKKNPQNERNRILIKVYNNAHPQTAINENYGSTNLLATQSTNGGNAAGKIPSEMVERGRLEALHLLITLIPRPERPLTLVAHRLDTEFVLMDVTNTRRFPRKPLIAARQI